MSTHTDAITGPVRPPDARDVTELLEELSRLRSDPFANDVDWLGYFERKADLLARIAQVTPGEDAAAIATDARAQVEARRELLANGGACGGW